MNMLSYFHKTTIEEVTGINTNISAAMYDHIKLWAELMSDHAPWSNEAKACGILPQIAGRLNYFVTRELGLEVKNDAIAAPLKHLNKNIDKVVEFIVYMGSSLLRPIYTNNKLQYETIPLGNYLPTRYDFDGTLTAAVIFKQFSEKQKNIYSLRKPRL